MRNSSGRDIERGAVLREWLTRSDISLLDLQEFYLTKEGEPRKQVCNVAARRANPWIDEFVAGEQQRLVGALGRLGDLDCIAGTLDLLRIAGAIVATFEQSKRRRGAYDFDDLIIRTAELLRDRPDAAWVLYKLDGGIEHLLVDEAQDTARCSGRSSAH